MRVGGVDPGKQGCCVVLSDDAAYGWYYKLQFNKAGYLDWYGLTRFLENTKPDVMVMEKVQGRGGMGATSTFSFGHGTGELNATLRIYAARAQMAMHYATPQVWQKNMHEGIAGKLSAKERSRLAYDNLFPHAPIPSGPKGGKLDDNIVDALLICTFGVLKYGRCGLRRWALEAVVNNEGGANDEATA